MPSPVTFNTAARRASESEHSEHWDGLVASWAMIEGGGGVAFDWSGSGAHLTLNNDPGWTKWYGGVALSFDGTNDYGDSGRNVGSFSPAGYWSVSAWIFPALDSTDQIIVGNGWGSNEAGWMLRVTSGNKIRFGMFDITGMEYHLLDSSTLTAKWTHVAASWSAGTPRIFIDGAEDSVTTIAAGTVNEVGTRNVTIGATPDPANRKYFAGLIGEVALWGRQVASAEFAAMYQLGPKAHLIPRRRRSSFAVTSTPTTSRLLNLRRRSAA